MGYFYVYASVIKVQSVIFAKKLILSRPGYIFFCPNFMKIFILTDSFFFEKVKNPIFQAKIFVFIVV